jgi:hypothetical protein
MKKPLRWWHRLKGFRMVGPFIAVKVETLRLPFGDWRWYGSYKFNQWAYYCPDCGERLAAGPRGGAACNCVCESCKVNFGTLPNNEHE